MNATPDQSSLGAVKRGLGAAAPLAIPALPIGVLLGVAIRDSDVVGNWAGWASSWLVFAGAAQFAAVELLDQGAGVAAVVAAIFMINARHLMYSAAIGGRFQEAPTWFKWIGSYFLIDQVFALNNEYAADGSERTIARLPDAVLSGVGGTDGERLVRRRRRRASCSASSSRRRGRSSSPSR